jgi:peroxiredoxin Q/BCP
MKNAVVLGISTDTTRDNQEFKKQQGLTFPLLSDLQRKVCMAYGACSFQAAYFANRITYLINATGVIEKVYPDVDPQTHAGEILNAL